MADWSTLPTELLDLISQCLPTSTDLLRFRSVCATWRTAAPPPPPASARFSFLPSVGISNTSLGFYLSKRNIYVLESPVPDHSSWIIKLERDNQERLHLIHPLSQSRFETLPENFPKFFSFLNFRVRELGEEHILKYIKYRPLDHSIGEAGYAYKEKVACLESLGGGYMLLTIHVSGKLVVYKSSDAKWRVIDDLPSPYDDVILREGRFYAVDNTGRFVVVNAVDLNVSVVANSIFGGDKKSLLEMDGELWLVDKYFSADFDYNEGLGLYEEFDNISERPVKFKVYRLDENAGKWLEMTDLGDRMLFLGGSFMFSASASEIFRDDRCRGNCIFFTDQQSCCSCVGVFDLESGSIGPISGGIGYSKMFWPPPDWVNSSASIKAGLNQLNI